MQELVFLKLGGSLITDKTRRYTPRLDRLEALASEIQAALAEMPDVRLVLGHGSGSFGHFAVQEHLATEATPRPGAGKAAADRGYWKGFSEVWYRASELNRYVMDALHRAGLRTISLAPSATAQASGGDIVAWDLGAVTRALEVGLVPVVFGDIVFDAVTGGTVLSTEKLMIYLAQHLRPDRILLAGMEAAVWTDFPSRAAPIEVITPSTYRALSGKISGAIGTDVTGGMRSKVEEMLGLIDTVPSVTVRIFSGEQAGNVRKALARTALGTLIASD